MRAAGQRPRSLEIKIAKLRDYLLDPAHPVGGPKARFFLMQGFSRDRLDELADALTEHAPASDWVEDETAYGTNLVFTGALATPSGKMPNVVAVGNEPAKGRPATLVTAYPA